MRGSEDFGEVAWFEQCWDGLSKDRWFQIDKHRDTTYLWGNLFSHSFCFLLFFFLIIPLCFITFPCMHSDESKNCSHSFLLKCFYSKGVNRLAKVSQTFSIFSDLNGQAIRQS